MSNAKERSAIITGAAKRVGRAFALALAERGYNIGLHFRFSSEEAAATQKEVEAIGVKCVPLKYDLCEPGAPFDLIARAHAALPGLSVLINNASIFEQMGLFETTVDDFDRNFGVHVRAPFFLTSEFARVCEGGNVINIVDMMVSKNNVHYFPYSLSKKALLGFTELAARELAPKVRVNAIAPGSTLQPVDEDDPSYMEKRARQVPLKMEGGPQYLIKAMDYFLGNPFVTGDCLFVDGGVHIDK